MKHLLLLFLPQLFADLLSKTLVRLTLAAILGGIIGLERQLRRKPAGLRTNMFIAVGAAMYTLLSDQLAGGYGGDHTRVAAQIIPGIGFIGAGAILHARGGVVGLTTAASVGMAVGGGLYVTATVATFLILIILAVLGKLERRLQIHSLLMAYEVTGAGAVAVLEEINRVLDQGKRTMQNVRVAGDPAHTRVMFCVDAPREDQDEVNILLHQSPVFATVNSLGAVEHE